MAKGPVKAFRMAPLQPCSPSLHRQGTHVGRKTDTDSGPPPFLPNKPTPLARDPRPTHLLLFSMTASLFLHKCWICIDSSLSPPGPAQPKLRSRAAIPFFLAQRARALSAADTPGPLVIPPLAHSPNRTRLAFEPEPEPGCRDPPGANSGSSATAANPAAAIELSVHCLSAVKDPSKLIDLSLLALLPLARSCRAAAPTDLSLPVTDLLCQRILNENTLKDPGIAQLRRPSAVRPSVAAASRCNRRHRLLESISVVRSRSIGLDGVNPVSLPVSSGSRESASFEEYIEEQGYEDSEQQQGLEEGKYSLVIPILDDFSLNPSLGAPPREPIFIKESMASFSASVNVKFEEGATFIFGSWLCTANQDGKLRHELRDVTIALRRELCGETMASPPPPVRVTVRRSSRVSDSNTIFGSYPTRRSTSRQKPSSTRTNDDSCLVALKYQDQADSRRTRLLGGLRIISSICQGTSVRTVTSVIQEARPRSTLRLVGSVARVLFLSEQGSFFDKNPDYGNQQGSFFDTNPDYDDQPSSFSTKNSDSARLHQRIVHESS
nr:unnamed protein product [Digitaria exilis]